jgi:hypothetical protein
MRDMRFVEQHSWYFQWSWMWRCVNGGLVKYKCRYPAYRRYRG